MTWEWACTTKLQCKHCPLITYARLRSDIKTCWKEEPRRNTYTCDEYAEIGQLNRSTNIPGFLEIVETKGEKKIKIMQFTECFKNSACDAVLRGCLFTLFRQSSLYSPLPSIKIRERDSVLDFVWGKGEVVHILSSKERNKRKIAYPPPLLVMP